MSARCCFFALLLGACHAAHGVPDDAGGDAGDDGGAPASDSGGEGDAAIDAGQPLDAEEAPTDGAPSEARWYLDQGPRALDEAPEWLSSPSLAGHGERVALTLARTDLDRRTTSLEAYVESPWASPWSAALWTAPPHLAALAYETLWGRPYAAAWDGEGFDAALSLEGETWGLTRLSFDAEPTPPLIQWPDLAPWLVTGDRDSGHLVVARDDARVEAWMRRDGRSIRVHAGCEVPVAAAADRGRRWIGIARTPCRGELGLIGADVHELDEAGAIIRSTSISLSRPEHTLGAVRTLSLVANGAGLWIAATTFEGAPDRGYVDRISVTWLADGEAPRADYEQSYEHLEQSGETVDAVTRLGDRLVVSHGAQDHFGDERFTLVVVSPDGTVARLAERAYRAFECGPPSALLGSPDGTELLVVSRPDYGGPLAVARLRER